MRTTLRLGIYEKKNQSVHRTSALRSSPSGLQEIAISLSEVLDARREANSAWELLGRSEALSEERLFTAAKEAKLGGGANKDRAKDLIDAYK